MRLREKGGQEADLEGEGERRTLGGSSMPRGCWALEQVWSWCTCRGEERGRVSVRVLATEQRRRTESPSP